MPSIEPPELPDLVIRCPRCGEESADSDWGFDGPIPEFRAGSSPAEDAAVVSEALSLSWYVCPSCAFEVGVNQLQAVHTYEVVDGRKERALPLTSEWWQRLLTGRKGMTNKKALAVGAIFLAIGSAMTAFELFAPGALPRGRAGSSPLFGGTLSVCIGVYIIGRVLPRVLRGQGDALARER